MSLRLKPSLPACVLLGVLVSRAVTAPAAGQTGQAPTGDASLEVAAKMLEAGDCPGGLAVVISDADAALATAIARQAGFIVQGLCRNVDLRDRARKTVRRAGLSGRVSADVLPEGRLPYVDRLINLVVIESPAAVGEKRIAAEEIARVLAPLGTAILATAPASGDATAADIESLKKKLFAAGLEEVAVVTTGDGRSAQGWLCLRKPWPKDIDEWTHYLHGADGNPVARDRVVAPPEHYQWIAGPMWQRSHETDSSVSTVVTARGRLFYIVDEAPISLAGQHDLPDKWCLAARDAFNGVLLWKVPIRRWGWREWKPSWFNTRPGDVPLNIQKRLVAVGDRVYATLGYRAPVTQLDARSGEILQTYEGTDPTGEILVLDGTLLASVFERGGVRVVAVDTRSGERKWASEKTYRGSTVDYVKWKAMRGATEPARLDPAANMAAAGDTVALIDGAEIVCLDLGSGKEKARCAFPTVEADLTAGGISSQGKLWVGTMIVADGVVLHASPNQLAAFDADSGELLWNHPKRYIGHLWYEWKDVFVIDGLVWTWGADLVQETFGIGGGRKQRTQMPTNVYGYDLKTGEVRRTVPLGVIFKTHHHHRCYRNKATLRYILASRRGTEYVDLAEGEHTVHNWVRGTCHVGMMPANGLQYAPPHPCQCYIEEKLSGFNALAPARKRTLAGKLPVAPGLPRLHEGPAHGKVAATSRSRAASSEDWPTFRHDAGRTGSVETRVPDDLTRLWRVKVGVKVSAPVAVDGKLYVALIDEHHVACLDAAHGSKRWEFVAGARVDSPPTWHRGTVLFGSADGCVYCLRAEDGALVWRFRAAPEDRRMAAFGQIESTWPVHGSVLVQGGKVYFAAGRASQLDGGIHLYALDAATGEQLAHRNLHGPDYRVDGQGKLVLRQGELPPEADRQPPFNDNYRLPLGTLPDLLQGDGERVFMRSAAFDANLNPVPGKAPISVPSGMLEGTYFKRVPWSYGESGYARLLVHDERCVYCVRQFDSLRGLDPTVYFTPGDKGYLLFAKGTEARRDNWSERIRVRIRTMVLTPGRLYAAGPPDVLDPKDPLGAFEGRKGGLLYTINAQSGERLAEHALDSPPVFNGAAAAEGRLYVAEEDGSIACFGGR